ncbi:hypothetical protein B0A48_08401 [Cryoendolithus antarcticus]|uniref:FAD-binding FR-type domain-containing protein n=1 Tax=Cryoendolithus antarcticus TaxID=1507870 RepID=A0A1V8T5C1_9PEZI|nr:hypothetical protein B0A48_08401 [Cryoendolithus antarcticus]
MKPLLVEKYLLLPAFIGKRHLRILPWNLGYVPQRSTSLMITIFVAVNVVFNFFNFPSFANDTWYVSSSALYTSNLANRLSVLAIANLALAIMLSGRNSIIMYITGCSRTTILAYHRWAGRVAVIKGVAHAAIYLSTTDKYGVNIFTPVGALHYIGCEGSYWNFGIATLGIFAAIALLSLAPIRVPWYEAFLIIHVALAVVGLVTLYYHLSFRFHGQYGYEVWLYVAFAFWGFDRLVRLIRIAVLNYGLMTRGTPPAKLELLPGSNFIKVTVYPSTPWAVQPGHYCFLYFSNITWFWESHPFSIATWDNGAKQSVAAPSYTTSRECASTLDKVELGTGGPGMGSALNPLDPSEKSVALVQSQSLPPSITFIIRPCSGITKRLQARLMAAAPGWSPPVLIEGPYGRSASSVFAAETVLAFAGGVGITGILGYLNDYTSKATSKTLRNADKSFRARRFTLHWLVQFKADVEAIKPLLPDANTLTDLDVHVHIFCREERSDRLQFGDEIRRERDALGQNMSLSVLTCAPPTMSDEIRASAVETDSRQGATLMFMEEAFAW